MAINLSDNVHVSAPKPVESKYLNITVPYTGTSQVNTCIVSGERYRGLTVNISNIEYWYKTGVTDTALVTKSAGGTWGSITGTLSGQTDLQTCLNGKLASGGTAICATTAGNALKLNNQAASFYLNTGSTALCAITAGNALCLNGHTEANLSVANSACLGGKLPAYYLNTGSTALCATTAGNALCLGSKLPAYYLNTGSTITCAADSAKLNNKLPAYYLNTGSTALCSTSSIDSKGLCGCVPTCFLGATSTAVCATCAIGSKSLCGCVPASFLLSGGTAICATCAGNASTLVGCTPSCFLGATACACDSKCLGGHLPAYYFASGGTALCATTAGNSLCLGGVLPAGYLLSGGTAKNSLCLNGHTEAALSVCNSVCVNGHAEAALSVCCAQNSANLGGVLAAGYLLSGGTAKNSLCLNGHLEAALSVCNSVCVNGHAESALSVANAACLGGNLANTYAPLASPNFTTCICTPVMCSTGVVKGTVISGSTCVESPVIQLTTGAAAGCVFTSNAAGCGVWCTPAAGGLAWSGSTANGVGTYISASKICSNANMTFDGTKLHIIGSTPSYGFIKLQSTTTGEVSINYKDCYGTDELAWTVGKGAGGIGDAFGWYWNGAVRMQLSTTGILCAGTCGTSVDWIATSDCRLKRCIKPIMGALSTVMQLQGVCYELCDDEKHENQIGLIAQSVQPILPEVVSHDQPSEADAKYGITDDKLGISYGRISSILIEAIKEQQLQIEEQQKQIICLRYDLNYWRNYNC